LYAGKIWTLRKGYQKNLGGSEMWYWRKMKISWTDRVRNEELLLIVTEKRNIQQTIKRRKTNWNGHILRRNWLLKHGVKGKIEGRIEATGRRGRRRKKLLDDL
jgi:hypothetical protein